MLITGHQQITITSHLRVVSKFTRQKSITLRCEIISNKKRSIYRCIPDAFLFKVLFRKNVTLSIIN